MIIIRNKKIHLKSRLSFYCLLWLCFIPFLSACSNGGGGGDDTNEEPSQVQMPNVIGLDEATASSNLSALDLLVTVERENRDAPVGEVVAQAPAADTLIDEGSNVSITVSLGISVPALNGLSEAEAIQVLTDAGLNHSVSYINNAALIGQVVSQSIAAFSNVDPGTTVEIVISQGISVPNVVGMTITDAIVALENLGFAVTTSFEPNPAPIQQVFAQDPVEATNLNAGSTVTISVSTGDAQGVLVPGVTGLVLANATQQLTNLGLTYQINRIQSTLPIDTVANQSIAANTLVDVGTQVELSVSDGLIVPDVIGGNDNSTIGLLESEGFSVEVNYVFDNSHTAGEVFEQDPIAGTQTNGTALVTISVVANLIAYPNPIVAVRVGDVATLDGSDSYTSISQPVSFNWLMHSKPDGSNATLTNPTSAIPSFIADREGVYTVEFTVSVAGVTSKRAIGQVVATIPPAPVTGRFNHTYLSSNCVNCHTSDPVTAGGKSENHMATSLLCQACHSPLGYKVITYVDHKEVFGACSECHNGKTAIGKSSLHKPTGGECSDCHNTDNFFTLQADGSYGHFGINNNCDQCHNGITVVGKDQNHIPTESNCDLCHRIDTFIPALSVDHNAMTNTDICIDCHNNINAAGKDSAPNHPVTIADCRNCHNTVDFAAYFVDHTSTEVLSQRCDSCHDNVTARGLTPSHMPINQPTNDCIDCHSPGNFSTATFDHLIVPATDCISCHDGIISHGKDVDHIDTTAQCSDCHSSITSFATNVVFNHVGIDPNGCASCHDGIGLMGKPNTHIPTQDDCSVCHTGTNTGDFAAAPLFVSNVHPNLTGGCEGCHNGLFTTTTNTILGKPLTDHIPTDQDCYFCHNFSNGWLASGQSEFAHTGITGNCTSCHDGTYISLGALAKPPVASGHPDTSSDCGECHTTSYRLPYGVSFVNFFEEHSEFVNNCRSVGCHDATTSEGIYAASTSHSPTNAECDVCHTAGATWTRATFDHSNISPVTRCDSCHNTVNATGMAPSHPSIPPNKDCVACHNTTSFNGAGFDHTYIESKCASCHNGTQASGKPGDHVPTNDDCINCHVTAGFVPAFYSHIGIVDNCNSCHNSIFAAGRVQDHIVTGQDCGTCHNITAFFPATFNHTDLIDNCARSGCHNNGATGKPPTHVSTNLDCSFCHTTATFLFATWDHQEIVGNCISCHDGVLAHTKGIGHFDTLEDCNTCHTTVSWAPVDYKHLINSDYPGDHNPNVGCISCHRQNNSSIMYQFGQYVGTCTACHANDYDAGKHNGGLTTNLNCGNAGCHLVSSRDW